MANLARYIQADRVLLGMKPVRKKEAIRSLTQLLENAPEIPDFRRFVSAMFQKESRFGSGVGEGVAIPHYRDDSVAQPVVVVGVCPEGIDWGDGQRVHLLVLIGWPPKHDQEYLKTVAEVARLLKQESTREALLLSGTPEEVIEILKGEPVAC